MASKAEKRRGEILNIVNVDGIAYVNETAKLFQVTGETIRKDFDFLAESFNLRRVHGGIRREKSELFNHPYRYQDKKTIFVEEKKRICFRAVDFIEDGNCIYIDGGSTVSYLLNFMNTKRNLTMVTPSIAFLMKYVIEGFEGIMEENGNRLVFAGGTVNSSILTTYGPLFHRGVSDIHFDKMFFSVDALDINGGCTNSDEVSYSIIQQVADHAHTKIVLADGSKFGRIANYRAMDWNRVDVLISDRDLDAEWERRLEERLVKYIRA